MADSLTGKCIADAIAAVLRHHHVDRVFGLCGGHIMPLWMAVHAAGIRIIDVRDERAAVREARSIMPETGLRGGSQPPRSFACPETDNLTPEPVRRSIAARAASGCSTTPLGHQKLAPLLAAGVWPTPGAFCPSQPVRAHPLAE